jgi:hypothetical protein
MKTLKVALLVSTVAGAVAAGGVTYATVGYQSHAPSASPAKDAVSKATSAIKAPAAAPALPSVPTCIPNLPKGAKLEKAKADIKKQIEALAAKAPQTPVAIPQVGDVKNKLPKVLPAGELAKLPVSKLPTCKAGEGKGNTGQVPTLPGAPGVPALPSGVDCTQVPQAIKNAESKAKQFTLPNGMQIGASHSHKIVVNSRAACVYTQELAGALPGMI